MEPDTQPSGAETHDPASAEGAPASTNARKIAWAGAAVLAALTVAAAVWGVQAWQTNRAMESVENSLSGRALAAPGAPAAAAAGATTVPAQAEPAGEVAAVPVAPSADRLPPLVLPGQPVPDAVLRDLPDWVAAEVAPGQTPARTAVQTSGASGDESAAPAVVPAPARPQRERAEAAPRKDRYGTVFARCPGPGESGAVECRRAVCDGAAKKTAACAPYLK
ncbi:hypothetical protein [Pseudoduganella albidiflava]|uniref:Meckel syndrome type 1 protein n=1 Tax=Pseudoduganella albidiflava TaxID=321983 RepID=A0A411WYI7_9BURK|nr:hypothetical protein [Pseudoduganella albidiflava]QBI01760.1 hypothetical protein EYF70_13540 [Pseudoduganella albidiflava]GGY39903.1 hypothetical protein GCM10007387_22560 [Pseudoduganella albidiflava]